MIREGIIDDLAAGKTPLPEASSYFIVTDSNVAKRWGRKLEDGLTGSGRKAGLVVFPAGEKSKGLDTAGLVASELNRLEAERGSLLLALGGGVVGDLTGFVASIYKRGVDYVQVPTTLLAQVDSSIGGKTGVDTEWGKNQLGTFHQPRGVFADPLVLSTLPPLEMLNGLAEIVKCAIIADRKMFDQLSGLGRFDSGVPRGFIVRTCQIKARVVSRDERDANLRAILNFGHTVGHAIESSSGYRLSHGACVILGMIAESRVAAGMGILHKEDFELIQDLLMRIAVTSGVRPPKLDTPLLLRLAAADKKSTASSLRMSLVSRVGAAYADRDGSYKVPVSKQSFKESIDYLRSAFASSWQGGARPLRKRRL